MRDFLHDPWQGVLAVLLILIALAAWYATIIWLWEGLDTDGRIVMMVLLSVALYGYGCLMHRLVRRSTTEKKRPGE